MEFAFTETQLAFRDAVRVLLEKECPPEVVRARWEGKPTEVWGHLADMGVVGMTAPEEAGGLGMDELDLVLILEECGRAGLPEPIVEHTAVVIPALAEGGGKLAQRWLSALASGESLATLGLGDAPLVPDADRAAVLLDDHDGCLHLVQVSSCELTPLPTVDGGRPLFAAAWYAEKDTKLAPGGDPSGVPGVRRARPDRPSEQGEQADFDLASDRAALGASAQLLGLADRMITMAVEYAREREQFGRPIGSFQAVQHRLADALLRLEFARPVVYRAAHAVARPNDEPASERAIQVSMGKAYAGDAAAFAARAALQVHGAIGYSWEHDLHLFMKRAWVLGAAYGDSSFHRRRVGDWLKQQEESHA